MTTEERLAKVEGEVGRVKRRTRWLLVALGLALGAMALVWALATSVPKAEAQGAVGERTVRANEFILEDERGRVRGVLAVDKDGPWLTLRDAAGQDRARLGVMADEPGLVLADENGKFCALLRVSKDGPALGLADENGNPRVVLRVSKDGPVLDLADKKGKVIWSAP